MHVPFPRPNEITRTILGIVCFSFIGFISIGIPLAVLPGYVHDTLGYSTTIAGLVIGIQYLVTLLYRPRGGKVADTRGAKNAVIYGLYGSAASGLFMLLATSLSDWPETSMALLLTSRVLLGISQALLGTGAISWGIGLVGGQHTAKVISWNGIASYGGLAIGAPLGVMSSHYLGLWTLGSSFILLAALGLYLSRDKPATPIIAGTRLPFHTVLWQVTPHGTGVALGSIGYGTLASFITLYYASRGWEHAVYCLTAFGIAFICARLLFANAISRRGGFRVAIACLSVETLGLLLLGLAPSPLLALLGAALTGFGLSLVYPALGVEAVASIPAANRSSALSAYAVFFDLSLGLAGPLMGAIAGLLGYPAIFLCSALLSLIGLLLSIQLFRRSQKPAKPL